MNRSAIATIAGVLVACDCSNRSIQRVEPKLAIDVVDVNGEAVRPRPVSFELGVDVGPARVGVRETRLLAIRNLGNAPLRLLTEPSLRDAKPEFALTHVLLAAGPCAARAERNVIEGGECAVVQVNLLAYQVGAFAEVLVLQTDDPAAGPRLELPAFATVQKPDVEACTVGGEDGASAEVCSVPGRVPVARFEGASPTNPVKRQVIVRSAGDLPVSVSKVSLRLDADFRDFSIDPLAWSGELLPGATQAFEVAFQPSGGGRRTAFLDVASDDPDEQPASIELVGLGDGPRLCLDTTKLSFGDVEIGSYKDLPAKISNCGTKPLAVQALAFSGSAEFGSPQLPTTPVSLAPGQNLVVTVRYRPVDRGPDAGRLRVDSNEPLAPVAYLNLEASGVEPSACVLDASTLLLDFGSVAVGRRGERTVTVHNAGRQTCTVSKFSFDAGASAARFVIVSAMPPPFAIPANGLSEIKLGYEPQALVASHTGTFSVFSNDAKSPLLIQVKGTPAAQPVCKLDVSPAYQNFPWPGRSVKFGDVAVGTRKTIDAVFVNVGSDACVIRSAALSSTTDAAVFTVGPHTPALPATLAPGQTGRVAINFTPNAEKQWDFLYNTLEVQTSENVSGECGGFFNPTNPNGCKKFNLVGNGAAPTIQILPTSLDFGQVTVGCNSVEQTATVYNTGTLAVQIKNIYVDPATAPFTLTSKPPTPMTLNGGTNIVLKVRYRPPDANTHSALLMVENDSANNKFFSVPLRGQGTTSRHQVDTFTQASIPRTDVLFVIDNSCSMGGEQTNIANNALKFIQTAQTTSNDYQIGVVSTDVEGCTTSRTGKSVCPGALVGPPKIIKRTNANPVQEFADAAKLGTNGSGSEKGLDAANLTLSPPNITDAAKNLGFLRQDAKLAVIVISDEEDQSRTANVQFYVDFLYSLKGRGNSTMVSFHAIVGDSPGGCSSADGDADPGARYIEVAKRMNGLFRSVCSSDWGRIAQDIGLDAFAQQNQYFLSRTADPATIVVKVNGVTRTKGTDYSYDAATNSIIFVASAAPAAGATVLVEYDTLCL